MDKVYIKKNSNFAEVNNFFQKSGATWVHISQGDFVSYLQGVAPVFGGVIPSVTRFEIAAPNTLSKVYKKINNAWVEQTDLTNVFEADKIYVRDL